MTGWLRPLAAPRKGSPWGRPEPSCGDLDATLSRPSIGQRRECSSMTRYIEATCSRIAWDSSSISATRRRSASFSAETRSRPSRVYWFDLCWLSMTSW